ncbi:MAG: CpsD/CapB family tyrosine-protein kinase [Pseudomonadota bacterium]|jgi:capsular exopolysaccharide synthesis family protein|nr:CpsD/CapB family tyrosine-protein kinase [Pseudomonadota bacterium]
MERLQAAMEKARVQRQKRLASNPASEAFKIESAMTGWAANQRHQSGIDLAWKNLPELRLLADILQYNRLVALEPGPESAPYDMLRTKLMRLVRKNGWKRIAILSAAASAGKSTTVVNLSFSFARQRDTRVMAFDFDMRRPTLSKYLGQSLFGNMAQVINGEIPFDEHVRRYGSNLAFGMNDGPAPNSAELLQSEATEDMLAQMEATYAPDVTLFDMPPMMVADDAHGFLRMVDAALIVMEAEKTPVKQIDVLERQVAELTNVAGIVLNKCRYSDEYYGSYSDYS